MDKIEAKNIRYCYPLTERGVLYSIDLTIEKEKKVALIENITVVALRNPYDILEFQYVSTYICAYEYTPLSISSLLKIVSGDREPVGKLPISLDLR